MINFSTLIIFLFLSVNGFCLEAVNVTVSTFVDPTILGSFKQQTFCFEDPSDDNRFSLKENRKKAGYISLCTESARAKGYKIEEQCKENHVKIDLQVASQVYESSQNVTTNLCSTIYSTVICNAKNYNEISRSGAKLVVLEFKKIKADQWKTVAQGEAFIVTESPGIYPGTIVGACRSVFHILPSEVDQKVIKSQIVND